jgi:hypothetical protein
LSLLVRSPAGARKCGRLQPVATAR